MGIKLNQFKYRIIDVSQYQGKIDWVKLASRCEGVVIRIGYGNTIDPRFIENITQAARIAGLDIYVYFYSDYYSNWYFKGTAAFGMSDAEWGLKQANNCWEWMQPWASRIKAVFLDIEPLMGAKPEDLKALNLHNEQPSIHANRINRTFLERLDILKIKNGIYASLGWLSWFWSWFRDRMLWVAWYPFRSADVDADDVIYMCKKNGWIIPPSLWQFAQDGDQDDDGDSDGITWFGTQSSDLDMSGWIGTDAQYIELSGRNSVIVPTPEPEEPENAPGHYRITAQPYLFIRANPIADVTSKKLGQYYPGTEVFVSLVNGDWGMVANQNHFIYLGFAEKILTD
ncbi:TPA: hypothetical protein DCQ22_03930 [Candidatus Nomurabacteria bacterium]|nr:hypothetical protein [Candidatus Nomurabacteria bacterium]